MVISEQQRAVENAVVRLLKQRPFYGYFLMQFRRELCTAGEPVGVTIRHGVPILAVNPERFCSHPHPEQQALLEHGLKHILHLHPARQKGHHRRTWDVACDLAINPSIENLPAEALLPHHFNLPQGLAAEEFVPLLAPLFETGNLEGEGIGTAGQAHSGRLLAGDGRVEQDTAAHKIIDDHSGWQDAADTPESLAEQVVRDIVVDAHLKSGGELPEDIRTLVEGYMTPPVIPWPEILRQFLATAGRVGWSSTWKRQHRRFAHDTPGTRKQRRLNLLVAIDTSESTDILELREGFARELLRIAAARKSSITVLYANSRIQKVDSFVSSEIVAGVFSGGGFTDLRPVFDYASTMQPPPAAVIYLTDGYGEAPEMMAFPTLWALTGDGQKPADWGVELRLDV